MDKKEKLGYLALGILLDRAVFKPAKKITLVLLGVVVGLPVGMLILTVYPQVLNFMLDTIK